MCARSVTFSRRPDRIGQSRSSSQSSRRFPPGDHQLGAVIDMSARHCDGLGTGPAAHCLAAGVTKLGVCPFTVVSRNEPASRP
jgi:hypothetical protein